jgi:hypothetical protein
MVLFGGIEKGEYEKVLKANNELRMKMEKLRLENTLLKEQIRALKRLPPELAKVYVAVQTGLSVTVKDVEKEVKDLGEKEIESALSRLVGQGIIEKTKKRGEVQYSVKTPDISTAWAPKKTY